MRLQGRVPQRGLYFFHVRLSLLSRFQPFQSDRRSFEIHFLHLTSPLREESPRPSSHLPTRIVLPALNEYQFRGDSDNAYLEDLVSRIDPSNVEQFGIALFN